MIENHEFEYLGLKLSLKLLANDVTVWTICRGNKVLSKGSSVFFDVALGQALTEANRQKEKPFQSAN